VQEQFIALAKDHLKDLRDVLRTASDEDQRATAAYVIGYAPRKSEVVNDLEYALKDADAGVRGNATHSLVAFAVLEHLDPSSAVKVSPTWFIEMLNSLSWTDRSEALMALQILTDDRDQMVLDQLRDRALPALVEMARWKTLAHALPAYVLLGRIGGIPEKEIQDEWSRGDRDTVIAAATRKKK
jgi:HEAT repeat protein